MEEVRKDQDKAKFPSPEVAGEGGAAKRDDALTSAELDQVSGGFNPQPDPPGRQFGT